MIAELAAKDTALARNGIQLATANMMPPREDPTNSRPTVLDACRRLLARCSCAGRRSTTIGSIDCAAVTAMVSPVPSTTLAAMMIATDTSPVSTRTVSTAARMTSTRISRRGRSTWSTSTPAGSDRSSQAGSR